MSTRHYAWWIRAGATAVVIGVVAVSLGVAMGIEDQG